MMPSPLRRTVSHHRPWPHHRHSSHSLLRRLSPRPSPLRNPLLRFLAFFLIGSLLGLSHPRHHHDSPALPTLPFDHHTSSSTSNSLRLPNPTSRVIDSFKPVELHSNDLPPSSPSPNPVIVVTPTYNRATQAYFLHRLGQTLRLVRPPLLWIVVEVRAASQETAEILRRTGVMYRHLVCPTDSGYVKDRGVWQRNTALEHIERHGMDGIVYFADDDNAYSVELFEKLREIRRFGTWPVAMLTPGKSRTILEGPVCNGSQIIGWHTNEKSKRLRRFHVDMSGFAFNSTILWDRKHWHHLSWAPIRQLDTIKEGFQETTFIEQVVEDESQMEAVPSGCSKIVNWHLHLEARGLTYPKGWRLSRNLEVVIPLDQERHV